MNEAIKNALEKTGLTQKDLATKLHVSQQAVSQWNTGKALPSADNCLRIYELTGVDLLKEANQHNKAGTKKTEKNMSQRELSEINTFEKSTALSDAILKEAEIERKYSYPVYYLLKKLLPAVIGLTYHQMIKHKDDDIDFANVYCNLMDYYDELIDHKSPGLYENRLEYSFYLMGMDLFESFEPYKIPNHDYCDAAMDSWYDFHTMLIKDTASPVYCELMVAITEVANLIEC